MDGSTRERERVVFMLLRGENSGLVGRWGWVCLGLVTLFLGRCLGAETVLYSTGFEIEEGYDTRYTLAGQQGWLGTPGADGCGNGLVTESFIGLGQQAYVGQFPLSDCGNKIVLDVWQPINVDPVGDRIPVLQFSVLMAVFDSTDPALRDDFGWTVFNKAGQPLFSIYFGNSDLGIYYLLESGTNLVYTDFTFENDVLYELAIRMDFASNRWDFSIGGSNIVSNLRISELGSELTFGDVDAEWSYLDPQAPGDNLMVFDNYTISAEANVTLPLITNLTYLKNREFLMTVKGEVGLRYAVEASTNLVSWTSLKTNTADNGFFDFRDTTAPAFRQRFYRARFVP